jgi:hypothetical protein
MNDERYRGWYGRYDSPVQEIVWDRKEIGYSHIGSTHRGVTAAWIHLHATGRQGDGPE